ncbi:MAG TPA: hypothetical protein DCR43_00585 [Bacteroidales bacterium]|nr:MAG: hypothetical protein A2X11_14090 [Bacteroidetes bacterium GWE2_42_24]OFY27258.1 MAG: hypothetical protein A2X09_13215 [Bacteroidetes bacterium GWF2_43_11]HAQ64348.1 hypothetical protein [Bacteroidales bacterium]HBZ65716.1 hypothetical protein [Bacteroidales bacterium]
MPFTGDILNYGSLSIVGVEKNTGKTECLNYIIRRLRDKGVSIALTSLGIDGESCDQVTGTRKPEIEIFKPMMFVTSESHFRQRRFLAEILDVSGRSTALGRLVTARALESGKVLLSGPSDTNSLKNLITGLKSRGVELTLVDGALSRKSIGSPAVTDAMILATGAAWSANIPTLVRKTKFICDLIALPSIEPILRDRLLSANSICSINTKGVVTNLQINSLFGIEQKEVDLFGHGFTLFVPGAVTDKLLNHLKVLKDIVRIKLIVRDFTRIFASPEVYAQFVQRGGTIEVLLQTKLLAICINPTAPDGTVLNSERLREALNERINLPIWDVRKLAG